MINVSGFGTRSQEAHQFITDFERSPHPDTNLKHMNRQNFYKEKFRQLKPGWQDCLSMYINLIDNLVDKNSKILDIGCGHGDFMKAVYQKTDLTYGVDPDKSALDRNQIIKNKVYGDIYSLPFPDDFFDLAGGCTG